MKRFVRIALAHVISSYAAGMIVIIWTIKAAEPSPSNWTLARYLRLWCTAPLSYPTLVISEIVYSIHEHRPIGELLPIFWLELVAYVTVFVLALRWRRKSAQQNKNLHNETG